MTADGFESERQLFERCIAEPPQEWDRILREACGDDREMQQRVRRLLDRYTPTGMDHSGFMKLEGGDPEYIGPYRILQRLGEGGMGIVYAAEQREPVRRRVAVKVLRAGYNSREVLARFDVERQALALMNHANIARILDAGTTADHRPYIVMEFVPGEPITRYCERRGLSLPERLQLFATVCDAVQHAHQRGVIHRDLKPSNILITEEDGDAVPKIIDFGIAKAITQRLTDQTLETKVGSLLGTPDYMSPEQAELSPLDIDTRADIYALGAVLYQLLTGVPPLQLGSAGNSYNEMQRVIREQVPAPPSSRVSGQLQRQVRGELDWITLKALEKQRGLRYASAADFAADVQHHLANETVSAGPPSRLRSVHKFVRRHWLGVASVVTIMVTLAISQLLLIQKNRELELERDRAGSEAATSARVTSFLTDIFRVPNPYSADAGRTTARQLLDRGRRQIEQDASLPDEVRLQLLVSLAQAYQNLGSVEDAIALYRQARSLLTSDAVRDPYVEFNTLAGLGRTLMHALRPQEAREPLEAAIRLAEGNAGILYEDTLAARMAISNIELHLGNFERALALATADFQEARTRLGFESEPTMVLGHNLAYTQCMTAQFGAAAKLIDTLIQVARRIERHDYIVPLQNTLGIMHMARGQHEDAERARGAMHEQLLATLGPHAVPTQRMTHLYAVTLSDTGRSLRMMEELVARLQNQYGNESPLLVETWNSLAEVHLRIAGHEAQAEHYLEQARVLAERLHEPTHVTRRGVYANLAKLHARRGREESALMFLRKVGDAPIFQFIVARDPDFEHLRDNPEFVELLGPFADRISG